MPQSASPCNTPPPTVLDCARKLTKFDCRLVGSGSSQTLWTHPPQQKGGTDTWVTLVGPQGLISGRAALTEQHGRHKPACPTTPLLTHPLWGAFQHRGQNSCFQPYP